MITIDNEQLRRGVTGIGTNVDLLKLFDLYHTNNQFTTMIRQKLLTVTPEVEKQLEGRVLVDGEFSFKIKEVGKLYFTFLRRNCYKPKW